MAPQKTSIRFFKNANKEMNIEARVRGVNGDLIMFRARPVRKGKTLSVVVFDREGTWTSTLLMHRPANSCLRHEPFLAAEPGQQLCLWSCTLSQAERG